MTEEKIKEILTDLKEQLGEQVWNNKSSILFTMKSKYGKILNTELASKIYDNLKEKGE
jgi:hypothetical protein